MAAATGEEIVIEVPSMGDSITEGTVVQWLKEEGDGVTEDEVIPYHYAIDMHQQSNMLTANIFFVSMYVSHRWWLSSRLIKFR